MCSQKFFAMVSCTGTNGTHPRYQTVTREENNEKNNIIIIYSFSVYNVTYATSVRFLAHHTFFLIKINWFQFDSITMLCIKLYQLMFNFTSVISVDIIMYSNIGRAVGYDRLEFIDII